MRFEKGMPLEDHKRLPKNAKIPPTDHGRFVTNIEESPRNIKPFDIALDNKEQPSVVESEPTTVVVRRKEKKEKPPNIMSIYLISGRNLQ